MEELNGEIGVILTFQQAVCTFESFGINTSGWYVLIHQRLTVLTLTDPKFYEARAVVLSNMGKHKQALEIYVFKIRDFAKAEE